MSSTSVGVVGGGIAGLVAALRLSDAGFRVTVLEASDRPGGAIHTLREEGFLAELGPNTVMDSSPRIGELIERLGLGPERIAPRDEAKKRFIIRDGAPQPIPMGPSSLFSSRLLSFGGKLRIFREPFVRARKDNHEETVEEFFTRRLGRDVCRYFVDPFVSGVYAGRIDKLSLKHAFPKLYAMEREHGGMLKGLKAAARERKESGRPRAQMFSFRDGLATLPEAFRKVEGLEFRWNARVTDLSRADAANGGEPASESSPAGGWRVSFDADGSPQTLDFDRVVWTAPTHAFESVTIDGSRDAALTDLATIHYPPVSVVHLGYARENVAHPIDGFGALAPSSENVDVLGILFPSSIFKGRAPEGKVLLTVFLGGVGHPARALTSREERVRLATGAARDLVGAKGEPVFVRDYVWPKAIPQYELGYDSHLEKIEALERANAGLYFGGSYRGGISVADSIQGAYGLAERIIEDAKNRPEA